MKRIFLSLFIISLVGVIVFISCQKELSCEGCRETNKPPFAIAGPDQVITLPTNSASLDGTASSDPDGKISEWLWTKISGPASFTIDSATTAKSFANNLVAGTYQFELKVTDDGGLFAKDTVEVVVNDPTQPNRPPIADAGPDQTINIPANALTIDGSGSTDPDNNISNYLWTKISGPSSYIIVDVNKSQTQVINLVQGKYQVELKVTDAGGLFSKDTMQITVTDLPCAQLPSIPTECDNRTRPQVCAQLVHFGNLSLAGDRISVASAGGKIVFAGRGCCPGSSRVDIYDMVAQTWSTAELSVARWGIATVAAGNKIFFAGGESGDGAFDVYYSTVDIYDASNNTWSVATLSQPRSEIAAATIGDKVFFAGGEKDIYYNTSDRVDIYDTTLNTWSTAQLSEPRSLISAVTANNKIYFAGGAHQLQRSNSISSIIDIYDITSNSWSTSTLVEPKAGCAGVAVANNIYWAGGFNGSSGSNLSCTVEIRDVNTQKSSIVNLFRPGGWWTNFGENAVIKDNKIVFFKGGWWDGYPANKFDMYDITTKTWSIGVLQENVDIRQAAIISVDNTIYVAGGYINNVASNQVWKLEF